MDKLLGFFAPFKLLESERILATTFMLANKAAGWIQTERESVGVVESRHKGWQVMQLILFCSSLEERFHEGWFLRDILKMDWPGGIHL